MSGDDKTFFSQIQLAAQQSKQLPPVDVWQPSQQGEIDIVIDRQGRWFHEGSEIKRKSLVRLFASVLRCDDGDYFLVTPMEKQRIRVEDLPFTIVLMEKQANNLHLLSNCDDVVVVGADHPLLPGALGDGPKVKVRSNLYARINRNVYYQLADLAEEKEINNKTTYQVCSGGQTFAIG